MSKLQWQAETPAPPSHCAQRGAGAFACQLCGQALPMITFNEVRKIALALENVEESTSYGTPAFKSAGKLLARLKEDGDSLVVGTTFEEREEMIAADPETYYITDHYLKYPWILVRLSRISSDALRDLLTGALRLASTKNRRAPNSDTLHSPQPRVPSPAAAGRSTPRRRPHVPSRRKPR
jgi:hypothetical protein